MTASLALFYLFGGVALVSALGMVLNVRNTVASAMSLVITMVALAAVFLLLDAYLVAVIQIMVYAGAIVVLFLFVVMLLNLRSDAFPAPRSVLWKLVGVVATGALLVAFVRFLPGRIPPPAELAPGFGGYREVGRALFTTWVLPFEVTSYLLLAAIVGAVVLAKRRLD
jgi:NADH-quinone oxidoreductase subunit J